MTAYDQHALRAFQVRALDYLLKPFDRERFTEALQRARAHMQRDETGDLGRRLLALVKDLEKFFRIHRSRIVNMERIQEMQPWLSRKAPGTPRTRTTV